MFFIGVLLFILKLYGYDLQNGCNALTNNEVDTVFAVYQNISLVQLISRAHQYWVRYRHFY